MSYFLKATLEGMLRPEAYPEFRESPDAVLELLRGELDERYPLPSAGEERLPAVFDIFISYSSKDALAVLGLVVDLDSRGYITYVDCFDPALNPKLVTRQTAETLRRRMVQSRCLFVATTQHTPDSNWVPWELGFTDGLTNKAAVLFMAPNASTTFGRQSYFSLYPEVRRSPNGSTKGTDLIITDPQATPPWSENWNNWLNTPKRY